MLAGVAPPARLMFEVLQRSELIAQLSVAWMPTMLRLDPNRFIDLLWAHAPARDKAILRVPEIRSMMIASYQEGSRQGMQAVVSDLAVSVRPWGAWIEEVRGRVRLWYGDADRLATPNMGKHLADIIPDACLTIWPHQGHLVVWDAWDEIMAYLAEPKPDAH
jgi:pimeloyl-ACP methyl ester carboxylesterase